MASRSGLLEQLAEFDQRCPFGLTGLPQPDLAARQRIGPSVDLHPLGAAAELLYVSGRLLNHDMTVTRITGIPSTRTMIKKYVCLVTSSRLGLTCRDGLRLAGRPQVKRMPAT